MVHNKVLSLYTSSFNPFIFSFFFFCSRNKICFSQLYVNCLTCSVVMGEGSFEAVPRNDIRLGALKAALNLEEEV